MNDLIGLRYQWGSKPSDGDGLTDCFQLVCEVRRRLGLRDYAEQFEWVYREFTPETFTVRQLLQFLQQNGELVEDTSPGDVMLFPTVDCAALGVVTDSAVMFISPGQTVAQVPMPRGVGKYFRMR